MRKLEDMDRQAEEEMVSRVANMATFKLLRTG